MIESYEKFYPCAWKGVVGRIIGESKKGSWGEINGSKMFSIPLFSTPHGTVMEIGVLLLSELDEDERKQLKTYEDELGGTVEDIYSKILEKMKP